ncbi:stage V sporulation protein AB [Bacillus sp. FJAT-49736]|uniref:stage V sporulation protein AB n=1 Tax=Bacillus sp. FJAT-49736 TaxID=2833582 RepID=UPI001BC8EE2D|nr:stage V sporulation protein AB [Bacillus sp. FJAT-49736]
MINPIILCFIGFAGGLIVGCGFVAFLTVLGIVPRLTQLTKTYGKVYLYEWAIVLGTIFGDLVSLRDSVFSLPFILLIPIGLFCGVFVGMIAAALTEVVNVIPILTKRIGAEGHLLVALMAIVFGKVLGSLFHWIYFVDR